MTSPLYRKEVLTPRSQTLAGEVILYRHIPTLFITGLLVTTAILAGTVLILGQVTTADGPVSLLDWLLGRSA